MTDKEHIEKSQGIKISRVEQIFRPRPNRIEAALQTPFIPTIDKTPAPILQTEPTYTYNSEKPKNKNRISSVRLLFIITGILILSALFILGGIMIYDRFHGAGDSTASLLAEIGKSVDLPQGEVPIVEVVTDLAPVKDQPFFSDAMIGDKVVLFTKAKRAVLYRPTTKKVIIVAPLK